MTSSVEKLVNMNAPPHIDLRATGTPEEQNRTLFETLPKKFRRIALAAALTAQNDNMFSFYFRPREYSNGETQWKFGGFLDVFMLKKVFNPDDVEEYHYLESYHMLPNVKPHIGYIRGSGLPFFSMNIARAIGFDKANATLIRRTDELTPKDIDNNPLDEATAIELDAVTSEYYIFPHSSIYIYGMNLPS